MLNFQFVYVNFCFQILIYFVRYFRYVNIQIISELEKFFMIFLEIFFACKINSI